MNIIPVGYRVLIEPEKIEDKVGSIVLAKKIIQDEQLAQVRGKVLAIGEDCWDRMKKPWVAVGDFVLYQRYSGMRIPDGQGGFVEGLLLLNDVDITAKVEV